MIAHLRRMTVAPFQTAAAVAGVAVGIAGLLGSPLGIIEEAVPSLALAWSAGYAVGGALIIVGLAAGLRAVEVVGLLMLGCGTTVQAVAVMAAIDGIAMADIVVSRLAFTTAALYRVHSMVRGRDVVQVDLTSMVVKR